MAYTIYATKADLAAYLYVNVDTLTTDHERMLARSSELVAQAMFKNYVSTDADHVEAAKLATCAQVEYWMQEGENKNIGNDVQSYSLDSLSVNYGNGAGQGSRQSQLSKRSINYLSQQGLLYRGLNARCSNEI